ncbi:MAG TPA: hypothetical protein VJO52_07105 [Gemmatimonadaceae bacterium]|nr:hypothetical protein [Gemmatimonadaceae bacterium]
MRAILVTLAIVALGVGRPAAAQSGAFRFEIVNATDSTITIPTDKMSWVKRGTRGIAVDPRDHDAMVARFQIVRVDSGQATALITGQTTRVTTDHVAVIERPHVPWYKQGVFWIGAVVGAAIGVVASR